VYQTQKQPSVLLNLCLCQIGQGKADDAEQLARQFEREQTGPSPTEQADLVRCKDLTRRHRLMFSGASACDSDRYREGIASLAEADRIQHHPELLLNIGLCYIKDRNLVEAERNCAQFKQEVPQASAEQAQSLADCEKGVALLREYGSCRDSFSQRAYEAALQTCQHVNKSALDLLIRNQTLLRVGYSQAQLGRFREALTTCEEFERLQPNRETDDDRLLKDCLATARKGLAPPPPPAVSEVATPKPWYRKWWVWTLVGVGVAGGAAAVAAGVATAKTPAEFDTLVWQPALTVPLSSPRLQPLTRR
jgi:tetratricopeptide (TPR) repeat protein